MDATTSDSLPFNYCRSALKSDLEHEANLGVNPFSFGMTGGTDQHTSHSTTCSENYIGKRTIDEPKPERWKEFFLMPPLPEKLDIYVWEMTQGGLGSCEPAREHARVNLGCPLSSGSILHNLDSSQPTK